MVNRQLKLVHLVSILCLFIFAFSTHSIAFQKDGLLKIYFFDIGQGDSIFIEAPNGNQVLIDGGPDNKVLQELGRVMPFYDHDIDLIMATHPHSDHISGLINILDRYEVSHIIQAKDLYDSPQFKAWHDAVVKEHALETETLAGEVINLGEDIDLMIIYPDKSYDGMILKKPHEANVVSMLRYKNLKVLLTGDMEAPVERKLLLNNVDVNADVLKVGHHGSKTSSTTEFLNAVSPEAAVIQVGAKNKYGHPSPETISRLENYGIKYYRNDLDGSVKLISDGKIFQVTKY